MVKHVFQFDAGQPESGVTAYVHNGRAGESGGGGDQPAFLRELR